MSTFKLLGQKRFLPFFIVQALGALNDNLFKNAMVILMAFRATSEAESGLLINLAAGLFILPFFLFSPVAGQVADRLEKSRLMRLVKIAEIGIMAVGAVGFFLDNVPLLYATLFLMGTHSAFFGPVKYSILPQHLADSELMAGNALVEMGTFLAILIGTLAGGLLAGSHNAAVISCGIISVAVFGYAVSRYIPEAPATAPGLKLDWNPFKQTVALTHIITKKEGLLPAIMGISWYWYFGATMLAQLPNFTKVTLHGDESVVTLLLAVFAISIGIGSLLTERLSRSSAIELGIVPLGSLGMSLFTTDLFFIHYPSGSGPYATMASFLSGPGWATNLHVLVDLALVGIFSSLFIVPLYALIQHRSDPETRSRVIAANNVYNSVFMVASALITMALYAVHLSTVDILLVTAVLNIVVCLYIYALIPEFSLRFGLWLLASTAYRLRYRGRDLVPRQGAAVIVCNHASTIDWLIVTAACGRPVRFVMDHGFLQRPLLARLCRAAGGIPMASAKDDAARAAAGFARISAELRAGNLVCVFPEGAITRDGSLGAFRPGIEQVLRTDPVPVVPMAIQGLWGSVFSHQGGQAGHPQAASTRRVIDVSVGTVLPPTVTVAALEQVVATMMGAETRTLANASTAAT